MKIREKISIDRLRELISYNPKTGALIWKRKTEKKRWVNGWNTRWAGKPALVSVLDGYLCGEILSLGYKSHQVAFAIHYGRWPADQIDHIDHNRQNNAITNLREVSNSENQKNSLRNPRNKTGQTGVWYSEDRDKYIAYIGGGQDRKTLGYFKTVVEATVVRKAAEKERGYHENHGQEVAA